MILPADDSLLLPDDDDGALVVDATEMAWDGTPGGLLKLLPAVYRRGSLIDRDAILEMLGQLANVVWARSSFVLEAGASPRYASDIWLDDWGQLLGRPRVPGESHADYRARLLLGIATITPAAIKGAVDAVVAQLSLLRAVYLEPAVDAAFAAPATAADTVVANSNNDPASPTYSLNQQGVQPAWAAFAQPTTRRLLSYYPDRMEAPTPPSYAVPLTQGGQFWILPPADALSDDRTPHAQSIADSPISGQFNADFDFAAPATAADTVVANSNNDPASPTYSTQSTHGVVPTWAYGYTVPSGLSLGERIISEVEQRISAGTAYRVIFDPLLSAAI